MLTAHERYAHTRVPKPNDPSGREFETMCLHIYSEDLKLKNAAFYGRKGQLQHGIDIKINDALYNGGAGRTIVIQCKDIQNLSIDRLKHDLQAALHKWHPKSHTEPRLWLIFATTSPNDSKLEEELNNEAREIIENSDFAEITGKAEISLHGWDHIEAIVKRNPDLINHFIHEEKDNNDTSFTQTLRDLIYEIGKLVATNQLAAAHKRWEQYILETHSEKTPYSNLPKDLIKLLDQLFSLSGDFSQLGKLLDGPTGKYQLIAGTRINYLRSMRVSLRVAVFDKPSERPPYLNIPWRPKPWPFSEEVQRNASSLLYAMGKADEQLLLAYWLVMYAEEGDTIDAGLRRALGLVFQNWPKNITPLPDPNETMIMRRGAFHYLRYGHSLMRPTGPGPEASSAECQALVHAYTLIRLVHSYRRGWERTFQTEHSAGGWAEVESEFGSENVINHITTIPSLTLAGYMKHFPLLLNEIKLLSYKWEERIHFASPRPPEPQSEYHTLTCAANTLIADCANFTNKKRRQYVKIITSNLTIERLVCLEQLLKVSPEDSIFGRDDIHEALQEMLDSCRRFDRQLQELIGHVCSGPAYFNHHSDAHINEESASISLMINARRREVMVSSISELQTINHCFGLDLSSEKRIKLFWQPRNLSAWNMVPSCPPPIQGHS